MTSQALQLYWFLPSHGDGRNPAKDRTVNETRDPRREVDLNYLAQIARAAEGVGFDGALVPFGLFCEDPWLISAALLHETRRLRFMIALRPGLVAPTLVAQMAGTFQRISNDRLALNVVSGGDPKEQHRYGDWLDHEQRYARAEEFLTVLRSVWAGPTDFRGDHVHVAGGRVVRPPMVVPPIFVGGTSDAAARLAARHADVYLCWGEPMPQMVRQLGHVRATIEAATPGRAPSFGTRLHVITRDRAEEAWAVADALLSLMDPATIREHRQRMSTSDSEGQRRASAVLDGGVDRLEVSPNMWAGFGLVRQGPGMTLVGSHAEVAQRIVELHGAGIEHLILSGQPHLEEAYQFGEGVIPLLREHGILGVPAGSPVPAGFLVGGRAS